MAVGEHVTGPATIFTGTGASSALEELGLSIQGIEPEFENHFEEVFTDINGACPFDVQYFPQTAIIRAELILWDQTVLDKVLAITAGGTAGVQSAAGTLMLAQGKTYRLLIKSDSTSGTGEPCMNFVQAYLSGPPRTKMGTRIQTYVLEWRALPQQQYTNSAGAVLWNRTCT